MQIDQILVTHMAVFCYLVTDEESGEAVLIDPAGDFELINERISEHNSKVKYVINTHGHWDHVSGNGHITSLTGASLLIHGGDLEKLEGISRDDCAPFREKNESPHKGIYLIEEGDVITIGTTEITVIHTPGHSPGSVCLWAEGHLFTGDTLFTEGYGRTDLPGGSEAELVESISGKILKLPDETVILPGHHYGARPTSTVSEQKKFYGLA